MMMYWIMSGVLGMCVGSFLNVCIYRVPREESVVLPRSRCPKCGEAISWYANVPVFSYILLRGRCLHCKEGIHWRYPLVEVLTGGLFVLVAMKFMLPEVLVWWLFVSFLIAGSGVDLEHMIIPDRFSVGLFLVGVLVSFMYPQMHGVEVGRWDMAVVGGFKGMVVSLAGAFVGSGFLFCMGAVGEMVFKKEAIGLGDVKLMAGIGAFVGWLGAIYSVFMGAVVGTVLVLPVLCIYNIVQGRGLAGLKGMQLPFGPMLAVGAVAYLLYGRVSVEAVVGEFVRVMGL